MEKLYIDAGLLSNISIVVILQVFFSQGTKQVPHSLPIPLLSSHLLVGDRDEALLGELPQGADVCPHVQLAAHQHHFGVGTKLLRLSLPLLRHEPTEKQI